VLRPLDTRQTRRDRLRVVTLPFLPSVGFSTRQRLCRVLDKNTRQINFCRHCIRRVLFIECNTR